MDIILHHFFVLALNEPEDLHNGYLLNRTVTRRW